MGGKQNTREALNQLDQLLGSNDFSNTGLSDKNQNISSPSDKLDDRDFSSENIDDGEVLNLNHQVERKNTDFDDLDDLEVGDEEGDEEYEDDDDYEDDEDEDDDEIENFNKYDDNYIAEQKAKIEKELQQLISETNQAASELSNNKIDAPNIKPQEDWEKAVKHELQDFIPLDNNDLPPPPAKSLNTTSQTQHVLDHHNMDLDEDFGLAEAQPITPPAYTPTQPPPPVYTPPEPVAYTEPEPITPAYIPTPPVAPVYEELPPYIAPAPQDDLGDYEDDLLSDRALDESKKLIAELKQEVEIHKHDHDKEDEPLEALIKNMMKPMLRRWLDKNLPDMVKEIVSEELKKLTKD
jgi:cell pole-organizing protein PopZ